MTQWATFGIVVLSVACVISRPFGVKEYVPAIAGAVALVVLGAAAATSTAKGCSIGWQLVSR